MKAILESFNQSPRKVRLVTNLVKGKKVPAALATLDFLPKKAGAPLAKLIRSAAANAKNQGEDPEKLTVTNVIVESSGAMLKRYMPRAFGRASVIRHKKSRINVTLGPTVVKVKASKGKKK